MMKICTACGVGKALDAFKTDARKPDGKAMRCKDCNAMACRAWRAANPGYDKGSKRKGKPRPYNAEKAAKWRAANREKARAADKAWRDANPEKARAKKARRRYQQATNGGHHTGGQIKALFDKQKGRCPNCRTSIADGYHVDHVMPIVLGGTNCIKNIQLLCAACNLTKHAKPPEVWARQNGRLI